MARIHAPSIHPSPGRQNAPRVVYVGPTMPNAPQQQHDPSHPLHRPLSRLDARNIDARTNSKKLAWRTADPSGTRQAMERARRRLPVLEVPPEELAQAEAQRPRRRGDCEGKEARCPWVGCKFHLYLNVRPNSGSIQRTFPGWEPEDLPISCADLVARMVRDHGEELTLESLGLLTGLTRERVRQIEKRAKRMLMRLVDEDGDARRVLL